MFLHCHLLSIFFFAFLAMELAGCSTFELPASNSASGEWQRPLDLNLHEKAKNTDSKEEIQISETPKTETAAPENLKLQNTKSPSTEGAAKGSLDGLKVQVQCSHWPKKTFESSNSYSSLCRSLQKMLEKYGAETVDAQHRLITAQKEKQEETNDEKELEVEPDLIIRYHPLTESSVGCGLYGWFSYLSFWLVPCMGYETEEGRLEFLNRDQQIQAQYPLKFRRRTVFGWAALLYINEERTAIRENHELMLGYILNRTYTLAAQKKIVGVSP